MKLRVIQQANGVVILCPNGSIMDANRETLGKLLTDFKRTQNFRGTECWNTAYAQMDDVPGVTMAFVDDANKLVILSDKLFTHEKQVVYISATEYAELHEKSRPSIKNMCAAGRIPGAYKTSSGWLIPKDAPYPGRKVRNKVSSCIDIQQK